MKNNLRYFIPVFVIILIFSGSGCEKSFDPISPEQVNFFDDAFMAKLFAEPSTGEINAVTEDWNSRDVSAQGIETNATSSLILGNTQATVRIVSHTVNGIRHFGAIIVPDGKLPGSLPVLIYSHGGDNGENIDLLLMILPLALSDILDSFVYVVPSFRSENLRFDGSVYHSEGEPSPWDYDVDDALALLNVALATTPEANPDRIAILGFSRGAGVGMLMAVRDPRIDLTIDFFGPTDFFGPFIQEVVEEAFRDELRDLPGLDYLNTAFLQPLKNGDLTVADLRMELVRRSPVYFADRISQLQVHHGTLDDIVYVGQAERLIAVMKNLGRTEPEFEYYIYEGGGHNPFSLDGSFDSSRIFLVRLLGTNFMDSKIISGG